MAAKTPKPFRQCKADGCDKERNTSQYCAMHRQRLKKYGTLYRPCNREGCSAPAIAHRRTCAEHFKGGMSWDDVMLYYENCRDMAVTWGRKAYGDDSVIDDLTQDLLLYLYENADLSQAQGSANNYVNGILWRRAQTFLFDGSDGRFYSHIAPLPDFEEYIARTEAYGWPDGRKRLPDEDWDA
jgi:hypothetical protein